MKVYRGMDIGTAKASPAARARVPHHLVDIADPRESFSTGQWLAAALAAIDDVRARNRVPLLSGGTALYLKACLFGLFEGPPADPELRRKLKAHPGHELHARLTAVDPDTAEKVHPNDIRRLVRALEVFEITGRPISEHRREWERDTPLRPIRIVGLRRDREDLYARINRRVDRMIEAGLEAEVRLLLAADALGPIARQALGYREMADWIEGSTESLEEAVDLLKRRTRHFARHQITWFKRFDVDWVDVAPKDTAEDVANVVAERLFPS
jgi:tRNA dimethylallyltransferase